MTSNNNYVNTQDLVHDMRSPLAAMSLALELLVKEKLGPLNQKQITMMISMQDSVEKLTHMLSHAKFQ